MSLIQELNLRKWTVPQELNEAKPSRKVFKDETIKTNETSNINENETSHTKITDNTRYTDNEPQKNGLDPKILLSLFGSQLADSNPSIAPLLGVMNGEKPDIMSLLPLIMQLNKKKDTPPPNKAAETINLNDYTVV
jgi:hypothetical protein